LYRVGFVLFQCYYDSAVGLTSAHEIEGLVDFFQGHVSDDRRANRAGGDHLDRIGGVLPRAVARADDFQLALPDEVDFDAGGLVSCAVVTAVHAYRRARIGVNDTVVVLGAGGIGLILAQLLKAAGAKVVVVSRAQQSLRMAAEYDADLMLLADAPECADEIREFSAGEGASCVFECVGTSDTMQAAASWAAPGGQIIVIGEEPEFPRIDTIQIAQRELEIIGTRNGSRQDAVDAIAMIWAGTIRPPIVGHVPLEEINEALDFMRSGQAHGRIVVTLK
jgi:D-arabinose 1-dehydrogenase-like Zn-dependent alcohol dehydrogenase